MRKLIAAALVMGLVSGCSTGAKTRPGFQVTPTREALETKGYALPMLQYDLVTSYKLSECPPDVPAGPDQPQGQLDVKVEAVFAADYVKGETFEVDYRSLASPLKMSDFVMENYGNGTLKGVNISAEDKTADVIKGAVESGVSVASLAMGSPVGPLSLPQSGDDVDRAAAAILAAARTDHVVMTCNAAARQALADAVGLRGQVKQLTAKINKGAKEIEAITVRAGLKLSGPADAARIEAIHSVMQPDLEALAEAQAALNKAEKKLVFVEDRLWPTDPHVFKERLALTPAALKWFGKYLVPVDVAIYDRALLDKALADAAPSFSGTDLQDLRKIVEAAASRNKDLTADQLCASGSAASDCLGKTLALHAEFVSDRAVPDACPETIAPDQRPCTSSANTISARADADQLGIFYRDPARARMLLCDRGRSCADASRDPVALTEWASVPQLGQLRFARFTNGPFQNNLLAISLRQDGSSEKFQYAEKSSVLAAMASSAATGLAKIDAGEQDRAKRRRAELLDRRADIAYERSERAAERTEIASVRTDEIAVLQYEFDKVTKERALLDARIPPSVSKEYTNETVRLEAIAAQLRAQLAIKQAQEQLSK